MNNIGLNCIYMLVKFHHVNFVSSVPGLHGIPARRAPMVEQAVQTVPLVGAAQKRGNDLTQTQIKQPVRPALRPGQGSSQVQKENMPTSKNQLTFLRYLIFSLFLAQPKL